jgi:hypothetical protein
MAVLANIALARPAYAAAGQPSWWNGQDCDGRVATGEAVIVSTDIGLGLQICYPVNYNGSQPDWSENIPGAVATQLEFECVELSERHLAQNHNMPNKGSVGGGKNVAQYYYNWYSASNPGLSLLTQGTPTFPLAGDVLSTTWGGISNGHTSVIRSVSITNASAGNATLTVDQQNVQGGGTDNSWAVATITMTNWQYTWSAGTLSGLQILHFGTPPPNYSKAFTYAGQNDNGALGTVAVGPSNRVYYKYQNSPNGTSWGGWSAIGDTTQMQANPALGRDADGTLLAFAKAPDNSIAYVHQHSVNSNDWDTTWTNLGGNIGSDPVVAQQQNGALMVFARGPSNALYVRYQTSPNGATWGGYLSLGGSFLYNPAVAQQPNGALMVFGVTSSGSVSVSYQTAPNSTSFSSWTSIGGSILSSPAVARQQNGTLMVFARGTGNEMYYSYQTAPNSTSFTAWTSIGGNLQYDPAVAQQPNGVLMVFAVGPSNALYIKYQQSPNSTAWWGWESLGSTAMNSTPSAVPQQNGSLMVFVRGPDNSLYENYQSSANTDTWNGWGNLGGNLIIH